MDPRARKMRRRRGFGPGPGGQIDGSVILELRQRGRRGGFGPEGFDLGGGPRGFGPGGPRGFGGHGGPGGRRRRKRGEIREAILRLLGERPMHGYEMIQEVTERSEGGWTPSPGSVYPMLQLLEDEGLIAPEGSEGRKVFSLTAAGTSHLAEHHADGPAPWEPAEGEDKSPHHRLRHASVQLVMASHQVGQAGGSDQVDAAIAVLEEARRSLYGILAGTPETSDDD